MTAGSTQRPERLTRDNAILLLVDHQVGLYTGIRDIDVLQLKHNVVGLTRAMLALNVPVIVTTTTEKMWGPLIPELAEVLPGVPGIERTTEAVYGALGMPFSGLVFGLRQYFSRA